MNDELFYGAAIFILVMVINVLSVLWVGPLAQAKRRRRRKWRLLAAWFGPLAIAILALLPQRGGIRQ